VTEIKSAGGVTGVHLWIIVALFAVFTFMYYIEQTPLINLPIIKQSALTGVHDLHRTLFLIPIIYAVLVYRVRGCLIASFAFLCVVLPRALFFSTNPDPLIRPLLFVVFVAFVSLLLATQLNRVEMERRARVLLEENQAQLIQAEKLTSLGQLAASIAHEVNNPLSGVLMYTQLLIKKINGNNFSIQVALDYLSKMETELTRSTKLIRNLLDFARQSTPTLGEVDINEVIERSLELAAHSAKLGHIQVVKELDSSLPKFIADFSQLQQVFTNLILNAVQAMTQGGRLTIRTSANDDQLEVDVQDTGCGISPENMKKLFTPFFTTKREVKGVGLGLAVSYGIIQRHRGRIDVQSKEGEGTTFKVCFPLHQKQEV
jgi:signal transduction histidine kinase